jgi:hypothetical protein
LTDYNINPVYRISGLIVELVCLFRFPCSHSFVGYIVCLSDLPVYFSDLNNHFYKWHFNSKVDDFNQEIKNYCSSTEDIKFINNKLISSLDPSLYSDGVHFSDAEKRHLVRIIKFHLNPFIGLKQPVYIQYIYCSLLI